jgi:hypothetical protein
MVLSLITWKRKQRPLDVNEDGFGQSLANDARFFVRFSAMRRQHIVWRWPALLDETRAIEHPIVSRFGDATVAVAQIDDRYCLVRDRIWHGWPDAPEFVFFALAADDTIWSARDFDHWPRNWKRPHLSTSH